jgi:predicted PurR-regulated permease PerM
VKADVRPRRPISRGERRVTYALKVLLTIAVAGFLLVNLLGFFAAIRATGLLIVVSLFFAYLVYPLVRRINAYVPLVWAIVIVYVALALLGAVLGLLAIPPLVDEFQRLGAQIPQLSAEANHELLRPTNPLVARLPADSRHYLATLPEQLGSLVKTYGFDAAQRTVAILASAVSVVATVVIVPILASYMLLDAENVKRQVLGLFAVKHRARVVAIIDDLDGVIGGFIRGQLIDGTIIGAMIGVMLVIMHVPYALLIAVAAGILNFIPYAGAIIGFVPSVLLALFTNGPTNALIVAGLFAVIQQVDGNFVAPRVLKDNVGLSPLYIILAILIGSELFGLPGTFLAVPVAAMLRVLREHLLPMPAQGGKSSL